MMHDDDDVLSRDLDADESCILHLVNISFEGFMTATIDDGDK
jgi:hypothetical protein